MNRRKFALSWGRKLFFGFSWPLSSLLGLIYLQSFIFPQTSAEMFYFATTFVGLYGLMTAVTYFILYCPLVLIFPSYYFSRIWALFIILTLNLYILSDAFVFSQFRLHINSFIVNLFYQSGIKTFLPSNLGLMILILGPIVGSILFWLRGERIWRGMQKRFSNPVKNWYLVIILFAFGISHLMRLYASPQTTQLSKLFPLSFVLNGNRPDSKSASNGNMYYPRQEMKCLSKNSRSMLFIVIQGWRGDAFTQELTPTLSHYHRHASTFTNHYSGSVDSLGGLFSLFYSLPPTYLDAVLQKNVLPVFVTELRKRKYDVVSFSQGPGSEALGTFASEFLPQDDARPMAERWNSWILGRQNAGVTQPYVGIMYFALPSLNGQFNQPELLRVDREIKNVIAQMFQDQTLKDTTIVITGDHGAEYGDSTHITQNKIKTPLLIIWPHRQEKQIDHFTSHYDVLPTLMKELWGCKNSFTQYSLGKSLYDAPTQNWHLLGIDGDFAIMDTEKGHFSQITPAGGYEVRDYSGNELPITQGRPELNLKAMRETYRFYKR